MVKMKAIASVRYLPLGCERVALRQRTDRSPTAHQRDNSPAQEIPLPVSPSPISPSTPVQNNLPSKPTHGSTGPLRTHEHDPISWIREDQRSSPLPRTCNIPTSPVSSSPSLSTRSLRPNPRLRSHPLTHPGVFKKRLDISCPVDNIVSVYVGIDTRKTPQRLARPGRPCDSARFPQFAFHVGPPSEPQVPIKTSRINGNNANNVNNADRAAPDVFTTSESTSLPPHDIGRIRSPLTNFHPRRVSTVVDVVFPIPHLEPSPAFTKLLAGLQLN